MNSDGKLALSFAASYAIIVVAFFVNSRFRSPVALFLIPLSASGCVMLIDLARRHAWKRVAVVGYIGGLAFAGSLWNPFGIGGLSDARGEYALGVDHFRNGDYALAIDAFDRSLVTDSAYAPAWAMRGRARGRIHQLTKAIDDLSRACALDSTFADAFYWLGVEYQKRGDHSLAEREYLKCIDLEAAHIQALTNLADVYFRQNRPDAAVLILRKALAVDSTYANAMYGMGYYWEMKKQYGRAAGSYNGALPFEPARLGLKRLERIAATSR